MIPAGRRPLVLIAITASAAFAVAATPAPAALQPYPLLVSETGLRVYGPPEGPHAPCPDVRPLPAHALQTIRRAVALAMPPLFARMRGGTRIDAADPIVSVGPASHSGYSAAAGGCGLRVWGRSAVAFVRLPHVRSASLSQHTFAVARMAVGWVLWAWIH